MLSWTKSDPAKTSPAWSWLLYLALLIAFAFTEEAFWNRWIWQEYQEYFGALSFLQPIQSDSVRRLVIPLLALPQATHYILDGFIWRLRTGASEWRFFMLARKEAACPS